MFENLKQFVENIVNVKVCRKDSDNKKVVAKNKSIAVDIDTINNVQAQPVMMQTPLIGEQARLWFNEHMKPYGYPGNTFNERWEVSHKFLDEASTAKNEFVIWVQDNSEDGIHLPPYKDCNAKAKELWKKYVKSPRTEVENALN